MDAIPPAPRPRTPAWRWVLRVVVTAAILAVFFEFGRVTFGPNTHAVIPNRIYRCSQPNDSTLRDQAKKNGIKTVLNLRGFTPWDDWYKRETEATTALDLNQEDVTLSAHTLPFPGELRRAIEVLDRAEYPILIHCKQGADRTGLLSTIAMLLFTDATFAEAKRQLGPRYGHWPVTRTINIDRFFDLYEAWLKTKGESHSAERFRYWVLNHYTPGPARSEMSWIETPPTELASNKPTAFRVKCVNRSRETWEFKPGTYAAPHIAYVVFDADSHDIWSGRCGLRFESIPPNGSTEVAVPIKGLLPGRYRLSVEMHDATSASIPFRTQNFGKFGDDALLSEFEVK